MQQAPNAFAAMIQRYMWKDREPPINPNRLAVEMGVSRQTVANWLNGSKPAVDLLPLVAEKLAMPLADVYRAAGYPVPAELQQRADVFEYLRERLEKDAALTPKERRRILEHIRELRERYVNGDDTADGDDADSPKASAAG
jgi:transcriptional regulator with XRE-family HTH domain